MPSLAFTATAASLPPPPSPLPFPPPRLAALALDAPRVKVGDLRQVHRLGLDRVDGARHVEVNKGIVPVQKEWSVCVRANQPREDRGREHITNQLTTNRSPVAHDARDILAEVVLRAVHDPDGAVADALRKLVAL